MAPSPPSHQQAKRPPPPPAAPSTACGLLYTTQIPDKGYADVIMGDVKITLLQSTPRFVQCVIGKEPTTHTLLLL